MFFGLINTMVMAHQTSAAAIPNFLEKLSSLAACDVNPTMDQARIHKDLMKMIEGECGGNPPDMARLRVVIMIEGLAFSGSVATLRLFSEIMAIICQDPANLRFFLTTSRGKDIFKRLLWCIEVNDK